MRKIQWFDPMPDHQLVDVIHDLASERGGYRPIFAAFLQCLADVTNDMDAALSTNDDFNASVQLLEALTHATRSAPSGHTALAEDVAAIIEVTSIPELLGAYLAAISDNDERNQILIAVAQIPERVDH